MSYPSAFEDQLRAQLGDEADLFFRAMAEPACRGIRLNPLKPAPLPEGAGDPVPWFPGMYYLSADSDAGRVPLHEAGAYYLQEPSAAAPPAVLSPRPQERVLDLCAAPGGKATAMALLQPDALVVANEIKSDRARILSANAERLGCTNMVVLNETPERLAQRWQGVFDAVLVDAPCSGEGMFRRHPETIGEWTPDSPAICARRQQAILSSAAQLVRPGGRLCYSTCTFNRLENELQIGDFLARHPEFKPLDFSLHGIGRSENGCLRLWPHRCRGEGHFVALLRKRSSEAFTQEFPPAGGLEPPDRNTRREAAAILEALTEEPLRADIQFSQGIWQVPSLCPPLRGLRVLRPGVQLLHRQCSLWLPDHALSHACTARHRIEVSDTDAQRYLHGETLDVPPENAGWCQVCVHGIALGWGKQTQGTLKNHYPKGLRK